MLFPKKTPLMIIALLAGFVVLLVIASNAFIAHSIAQLEREYARQHIKSVLYAFNTEVSELAAQATDWANWDDTYQFMADGNQAYLTSNYPLETFQTLGLNLAMLVDTSGRVVFSKAYDAQSESEAPPPSSLLQSDLLSTLVVPARSTSGLLNLPEGPLLFAAEPIRTSARTGPPRGILLFGRWLDDTVLGHFAGVARSEITSFPWQAESLPADFAEARERLSDGELEYVRTLNDEHIAAYAVLRDAEGAPALIVRAVNERDIYQHGLVSRTLFTVLLLAFAGATSLAIVLLVIQMLESGQELSDILNGSADPIVMVTAEGAILKANTVFEAICGPGQRSLLDVVCPEHPEHRAALQTALRNASASRSTQTLPEAAFRCQSLTRQAGEFEVVLSPLRARLQRSPRLIVTLHDLTPQKQMEAHLRSALNREIEINRLKTQFLSVASHEFRTPLAVIQSAADLLNLYWDRQTDDERRERLLQIKNAVATMRQLTDDLLVHMRTETGALEVHPEPLDINALAQRVASEVALTQGTDVHISLHPAPTPRPVQADPNLMTLVLRNLLSNAVKYSPPGKTVQLSIAQDNGHTVLTLRDEGIGIPPEEQAHLFTPFFRASNVGRTPGTGLGLSIVKRAVELQGGAITFESTPGHGTTFHVTLPHGAPTMSASEVQPQHLAEAEIVHQRLS